MARSVTLEYAPGHPEGCALSRGHHGFITEDLTMVVIILKYYRTWEKGVCYPNCIIITAR